MASQNKRKPKAKEPLRWPDTAPSIIKAALGWRYVHRTYPLPANYDFTAQAYQPVEDMPACCGGKVIGHFSAVNQEEVLRNVVRGLRHGNVVSADGHMFHAVLSATTTASQRSAIDVLKLLGFTAAATGINGNTRNKVTLWTVGKADLSKALGYKPRQRRRAATPVGN